MSLPLAFATDVGSIPHDVPYLAASPERIAFWRERIACEKTRRIGIVWAGSRDFVGDRKRSIPLDQLAPLFDVTDVQFVSLQREVPSAERAAFEAVPTLLHVGDQLRDFADTAAVIAMLDLVISVDTAVAHLAGALAKPVWILLPPSPDFRWMLDRDDSPWYPTARLFRQGRCGDNSSDWTATICRVRAALGA